VNVTLRLRLTKQEFLEWEERQKLRYEFDGQRAAAMVGATQAHELIVTNIVIALGTRLRGGPCRVFGSGMKIEAAGSIRYPDATVACGPVQPRERLLANPTIVFEVESDSTALLDQTVKNPEYEATPSILRYVMLSQDSMAAMVFARMDGAWAGSLAADPAKVLAMPEIGAEVPLGEFYDGVTLPAPDADRRSRYRRR
jgi:Uma2 family endonuclease